MVKDNGSKARKKNETKTAYHAISQHANFINGTHVKSDLSMTDDDNIENNYRSVEALAEVLLDQKCGLIHSKSDQF